MEQHDRDASFERPDAGGRAVEPGTKERRQLRPGQVIKTGLKLLLACLVAGWLLSVLGTDALGFLRWLSQVLHGSIDLLRNFFAWSVDFARGFVEWSVSYILLGAVVVVPFFLIRLAWRQLKRR